ncbi:uncharacterized protein BP5553_10035 [Venustampulla echinocandica]|uniref:Uncharacterized protein n=1 Tax=Venustampulla echinocandica TaxID=2656787 RepID=A0A370TA84_9HELO|nr:uncharacterized protein BP5553_10035 [Venustampulla echinocandica]RDL30690.1 hypothetical protein BP5553_10035 [Venustampulla echinocandica]
MGSIAPKSVRIGVDVGGTNTDAVAIDFSQQDSPSRGILSHHKTPTTADITSGIETAVRHILQESQITDSQLASVTIGTTAFLNSVIEQDTRRLSRVAIIRLSRSFLRDVKPFSGWPAGLAGILNGYVGYVDGGLQIDGSEEAPVVEEQVMRECQEIKKLGLTSIVVAGVYSPIDKESRQEERVRDIIAREIPGADIVCSHEVANIGFLERENASILNAAILRYARQTVRNFRSAMKRLNLTCPLFLTQNDGTLLESASAAKVPIRTFSSGATNSMRGAAYLSGHKLGSTSAIVVDIGGTTTDVGILLPSGFPKQASAYVTVSGVSVNYSMPHLHSIGLGGGSLVLETDRGITIGPESVGHDLATKALVFGGSTITATDIAVAAGKTDIGSRDLVGHFTSNFLEGAQEKLKILLERAIEQIKPSEDPLPVLLVGGGTILAPDSLHGASKLVLPPFHGVANAVGAACSKVGGTVDMIQSLANQTSKQAREKACEVAIARAVKAGALEGSVEIAEIDAMPIPYLANQLRIVVKAIGDLDLIASLLVAEDEDTGDDDVYTSVESTKIFHDIVVEETPIDHHAYRPTIVRTAQGIPEWLISAIDIDYISDGCYVLGCGGGGSPGPGRLQLLDMLKTGYQIRCVDHSALEDDAVIYWGGRMGSPATTAERLQAHETVSAIKVLMEYLGHSTFAAVMPLEIGGSNGLEPFLWGSDRFYDRPIIDGDFMGKANPCCWQNTLSVHAPGNLAPCSVDSGDGQSIVMTRSTDDPTVDKVLRGAITEMGSLAGLVCKPTTGAMARKHAVLNTVSLSWRIGRAIAQAQANNALSTVGEAIIKEVGGAESAKIIFRGKIVSVENAMHKGHSVGVLTIVEVPSEEVDDLASTSMPAVVTGGSIQIPFKNENIYVEHTDSDGTKKIVASAPDLIAVLDKETGRAVGVPEYRYGYHVVVIGITCSPRWTETERGIEIGGPKGYGYDFEYVPLGKYVEPRSVIMEYAEKEGSNLKPE